MRVTIDIPNFILALATGFDCVDDDDVVVIGHSRVAFVARDDSAQAFLPAAVWHDAAYSSGASIQREWTRAEVDAEFLRKMIKIAGTDLKLTKTALYLYLLVRQFGAGLWEGKL